MVIEQITLKRQATTTDVTAVEGEGTTTDHQQPVTEIILRLTRNAPVEELERWEAEQGFDKADDL